jgi:hypothetical protein
MTGLEERLGRRDGHRLFHFLRAALVADQHGVEHGRGDDIVEADTDDGLLLRFGPQQGIVTVDRGGGAEQRHAVFLRLAPDRGPVAQVRPAPGKEHYAQVVGLFHHRAIDRDCVRAFQGRRVKPRSHFAASRAAYTAVTISGAWVLKTSSVVRAVNRKMPAFYR